METAQAPLRRLKNDTAAKIKGGRSCARPKCVVGTLLFLPFAVPYGKISRLPAPQRENDPQEVIFLSTLTSEITRRRTFAIITPP